MKHKLSGFHSRKAVRLRGKCPKCHGEMMDGACTKCNYSSKTAYISRREAKEYTFAAD